MSHLPTFSKTLLLIVTVLPLASTASRVGAQNTNRLLPPPRATFSGNGAIGARDASSAQTLLYTVDDLGQLPGVTDATIPFAINSQGQVVGNSGSYPWRAFVYTDGVGMVELFGPGGRPYAIARGINDAGIVVGEAWGGGMLYDAARWTNGLAEDLGAIGTSSRAWDISPDGVTVGDTPVDALDTKAFSQTDADGMQLITPEHFASHATDINAVNQVAGYMTVGNALHAYRLTPGVGVEDLGVINGYLQSMGSAINISGQVAGSLSTATGNSEVVYRFTDGLGMVELGGVGEANVVTGMNARGDFVGRGRPTSGIERAFLYTDAGGLQDLELLVAWPPTGRYRLLYANDINDAGQIVGLAYNHDDNAWHAVRLNPKIPVGPLAALAVTPVCIEAGGECTGWATLTDAAPPGGAVVALSSSDPGLVEVPGSIAIPEGERNGQFVATTMPVILGTSAQVTAEYNGQVQTATIEVTPSGATGVGDGPGDVPAVRMSTVAPNPARHFTRFEYELSQPAVVKLRVYDVTGRLVRTLVDSPQTPNVYPVLWDGRDDDGVAVPSGTYFFRLEAGVFRQSGKVLFVR